MRLFSLAVALLVGCGAEPKVVEICDNTLDDDLDGAADCQDSDCLGACPELCGDTVDNDGDGAADCADTDCDGSCPEQCGDGRDNDADGLTDCDDSDCAGGCPEICGDGVDNDGDGDKDCDDPDCAGPECPEVCANLLDDDGDGAIDCFDEDCDGSCPEDCTDGRDNDLDGDTDCLDRDCDGSCPEVCDDLRDNDGNGVADCNDPVCLPVCDADRDGFLTAERGGDDCNDNDPLVNPDMQEVCNGKDDDCDFFTDDGDPDLDLSTRVLTYEDEDGDGFGTGTPELRCLAPGRVANDDDCDDEEPTVNPESFEVCDDLDNDCDRLIDDADPDVQPDDFLTFYRDRDADGFGDPAGPTEEACSTPAGFADNGDDCDDRDPLLGGPTDWLRDRDGDGVGSGAPVERDVCAPSDPSLAPAVYGEDCNEGDPTIFPGADEVCDDGIDQDCDAEDAPCRGPCAHRIEVFTPVGSQGQWCDSDAPVNYRNYGRMTYAECECKANLTGTQWFVGIWTDWTEGWIGKVSSSAVRTSSSDWTNEVLVADPGALYECTLGQVEHRREPTVSPPEMFYTDGAGLRWHYWELRSQTVSQAMAFADDRGARILSPDQIGRPGESGWGTAPTHWCHANAKFNDSGNCNSDVSCNYIVGYFE